MALAFDEAVELVRQGGGRITKARRVLLEDLALVKPDSVNLLRTISGLALEQGYLVRAMQSRDTAPDQCPT